MIKYDDLKKKEKILTDEIDSMKIYFKEQQLKLNKDASEIAERFENRERDINDKESELNTKIDQYLNIQNILKGYIMFDDNKKKKRGRPKKIKVQVQN